MAENLRIRAGSATGHAVMNGYRPLITALLIMFTLSYCAGSHELPMGDTDNGGLLLPEGFDALIVADSTGRARHLAVNDNGDIYVKLRVPDPQGIVADRKSTRLNSSHV